MKLKQMLEEGLVPYRNIFREMKKQESQAEITTYLRDVTAGVPASPASRAPPITQREDNEDGDPVMIDQ